MLYSFVSKFIGFKRKLVSCRKLINISLHFPGFNFMLRETAKLFVALATISSKLIEFLGIISKADVSSTNLIRKFQSIVIGRYSHSSVRTQIKAYSKYKTIQRSKYFYLEECFSLFSMNITSKLMVI